MTWRAALYVWLAGMGALLWWGHYRASPIATWVVLLLLVGHDVGFARGRRHTEVSE